MHANASTSLPFAGAAAASQGAAHASAKSAAAGGFKSHLKLEHTPPAQAARAALEERPDLADRPFGAIVSLLARGEELPTQAGGSTPEPIPEPTPEPTPEPDPTAEGGNAGGAEQA